MQYKTINCYNLLAMEDVGQPEPREETPIYVSPYEIKQPKQPRKPKRTEEEIKQQRRDIARRHYYANREYKQLQRTIYVQENLEMILEKQRIYRARKRQEQREKGV